uniref:Uncharacterized protein n=1 Tax=Rhizophora mucronata TaxID=61149 RepID=A0A2P2NNM3_RHIMU
MCCSSDDHVAHPTTNSHSFSWCEALLLACAPSLSLSTRLTVPSWRTNSCIFSLRDSGI